jgi:hypothetical protein
LDATKAWAGKLAQNAEWILGRRAARVLGAVALLAVVVALLMVFLDWYVAPNHPGERKDLVLTLAQILGGIALLSGLYFTWRTLQVNREGQITERFTRAIDQLGATDDDGNPRFEIRLGGIYALERIARDSPTRDYSTVMEVLTAYVRENAPWPAESTKSPERDFIKPPEGDSVSNSSPNEATEQDEGAEREVAPTSGTPRTDIQAVLDILKRREEDHVPEKHRVRLDLRGTNLQGATLFRADLQGATLFRATLSRADLIGANLRGARGLTQEQIEWTFGCNETELPEGLNRPQLWSKSIEEQTKIVQERLLGQ